MSTPPSTESTDIPPQQNETPWPTELMISAEERHASVVVSGVSLECSEQQLSDFLSFCGAIKTIHMSRIGDGEFQTAVVVFNVRDSMQTALLLTNAKIIDHTILVTTVPDSAVLSDTTRPEFGEEATAEAAMTLIGDEAVLVEPFSEEGPIESEKPAGPGSVAIARAVAGTVGLGYSIYDSGKQITSRIGEVEPVRRARAATKTKWREVDSSLHISETVERSTAAAKVALDPALQSTSEVFKEAGQGLGRAADKIGDGFGELVDKIESSTPVQRAMASDAADKARTMWSQAASSFLSVFGGLESETNRRIEDEKAIHRDRVAQRQTNEEEHITLPDEYESIDEPDESVEQ